MIRVVVRVHLAVCVCVSMLRKIGLLKNDGFLKIGLLKNHGFKNPGT